MGCLIGIKTDCESLHVVPPYHPISSRGERLLERARLEAEESRRVGERRLVGEAHVMAAGGAGGSVETDIAEVETGSEAVKEVRLGVFGSAHCVECADEVGELGHVIMRHLRPHTHTHTHTHTRTHTHTHTRTHTKGEVSTRQLRLEWR